MAKIIAVANDFAFGPVGTLLTITKPLLLEGHDIIFVGNGTAYQLGSKAGFQQAIKQDTRSPGYIDFALPLFQQADLILSSMDRLSVYMAQMAGKAVVYIDVLFWYWEQLHDSVLQADCYIKQNTLHDTANVLKFQSRMRNLQSVGPIIDLSALKNRQSRQQLLVAYGGMEAENTYRVGVETGYPYFMTEVLLHNLHIERFERVLFTGNERIMEALHKKHASSRIEFMTLPHEQYLQEVANSALVLSIPGLEAPLECFGLQVPTFFLPPSNISQYLQLDHFREREVAHGSIHLRDYYPELIFTGLDYHEKTQRFFSQLRILEQDQHVLLDMARRINACINNSQQWDRQRQAQTAYLQTLGGNGLPRTLELIRSFLPR